MHRPQMVKTTCIQGIIIIIIVVVVVIVVSVIIVYFYNLGNKLKHHKFHHVN
jgi:flagellar basal body-associated protein FliL